MKTELYKFINLKEVTSRVCLGKTTVLQWEAEGKFPRAVRLSPNKRVWLDADITQWMLDKHSGNQSQGGVQ
jgi:prophage regulatory protein